MPTIEVFLAKALLCISGLGCYPVLVGEDTVPGEHTVQHVVLDNQGNREDVLMYKWTGVDRVQAIHPATNARRRELLNENATERVTLGCINVNDDVFLYLLECCKNSQLKINP